MDLKQIEYIVQIAKENNITRAAEKLFITQSALNQQLLKLERELGTPLFYRSRTNWRMTSAGEVYIKNALEILQIRKETYDIINDIVETRRGHLSVGLTPGRGIPMFTKIYSSFYTEYPNIEVTPMEMSVKQQLKLIVQGELDIGFLTVSESNHANIRYINICDEHLVLAVPAAHPLARYAPAMPFPVSDLSNFKNDSFVLIYRESSLRPLIDGLFSAAGFEPKVLFETASNSAIITIIKSGMCCGIVPYYYVKEQIDGIACFYLPGYPKWSIVACVRNESYLSQAGKRFIELASDYWNAELKQVSRTH